MLKSFHLYIASLYVFGYCFPLFSLKLLSLIIVLKLSCQQTSFYMFKKITPFFRVHT